MKIKLAKPKRFGFIKSMTNEKQSMLKMPLPALVEFYEENKAEMSKDQELIFDINSLFNRNKIKFTLGEHLQAIAQIFGQDFMKAARETYWNRFGKCSCPRCSGAGGWNGWPGFTCYECKGVGFIQTK